MDKKIALPIFIGLLAFPIAAFAQLHGYGPDIGITDLTSSIETTLWVIFGAIAVVCFIIAGILFLTAQGAAEKLQTARSALIWGVAGVVIGIVAYSIVAIISSAL